MGLFDKVNQMSRSVSESSKNAAETSNLKKKIAYEQERIQEQLSEIGRLFYENRTATTRQSWKFAQTSTTESAGSRACAATSPP